MLVVEVALVPVDEDAGSWLGARVEVDDGVRVDVGLGVGVRPVVVGRLEVGVRVLEELLEEFLEVVEVVELVPIVEGEESVATAAGAPTTSAATRAETIAPGRRGTGGSWGACDGGLHDGTRCRPGPRVVLERVLSHPHG